MAWGLFRFGLGAVFGIAIFLAHATLEGWLHRHGLDGAANGAIIYLAIYIPVRVIEWSIVSNAAFDRRLPAWIAGGVVVSLVADIPRIALNGWHLLPVGRFLC